MGSLFDLAELKVLDNLFGASSNTPPSVYYIGLSTTTIAENGSGITEPSGSGYARVAATNNKTTFTDAAAGSLANEITLSFPQASGSWGTVVDFFMADVTGAGASTNYWGYGTLTASKTIQSGDTASFAAGALTITLT